MKLDIMTKCGPMQHTGVDPEAVAAFLNLYVGGEADVLNVPDGSATKKTLVDRDFIWSVTADVDDEPEPPAEGDAEGVPAPEESEPA